MGSSLSQRLCCVVCERCGKQEAADGEPSETKPILQAPGDAPTFLDAQPPTPALKVPKQGSKGLVQGWPPSADALEENGDTCSAADPVGREEGWEAAWNPMDFFAAPGDEEVEGEVQDLIQQEEVVKTEEEIKAIPEAQPAGDPALGAELVAEEQPGSEGALCAGMTLQEGNVLSLTETSSETEPGRGRGTEPPADTGEVLIGRAVSLRAAQEAGQPGPSLCAELVQGTDRAGAAETSPQSAQGAELTCLVEATSLLTLQNPSEVVARSVAELYSASAMSWESLCLQWGSLEPPNQLLELRKQGMQDGLSPAQGTGTGPAGLSEVLQRRDGALGEPGREGSRACAAGAEAQLQHRVLHPTAELPEEPAASVPTAVKQGTELPDVPPSLPEVLGSSGEREAENVEA